MPWPAIAACLLSVVKRSNRMKENLPDPELLMKAGEPFAAGFCECPDASPMERYSRAYRRWFEQGPLPEYCGGHLYPSGPRSSTSAVMVPWYAFTFGWNQHVFEERMPQFDADTRRTFEDLKRLADDETENLQCIKCGHSEHSVGGAGYTHGIVNYGRVLAEGLDAYETRVRFGLARAEDAPQKAFYVGLIDLLAGIRALHSRSVEYLRQSPESPERDRLIAALSRVPFQPARSFYEAMVAYNFTYYLDDCDNPGRLDAVLWPYYKGASERDAAIALLSEFADNVSANAGWTAALGGSHVDGTADYQAMTEIVLAATHGRYRPTLELRVRPDMPDSLWEAAFDSLASGNGQPAFYNEAGYLEGLREADVGITEKDLVQWSGGGCTETMIQGCSNVGSLDAGFNLPLVLVDTLRRTLIDNSVTFDAVLVAFRADMHLVIHDLLGALNGYFTARAVHRPQPMRSLLMDDCVDLGRDFNNGGARYNWSIVNVAGLANIADSLESLRTVVFTEKAITPRELCDILECNFEGHEALRLRLAAAPKYGNDHAGVDALAAELADFVYREIRAFPCARGGRFLPSHIMFETFAWAGKEVGATPDGRRAGEPLADSAGPVQGRDKNGPTAMLRSVARLPQRLAVGTPVLNMRFSKASIAGPDGRRRLRALIETYFQLGGLQVQVSITDRTELEDALLNPEQHKNLIVRIGGYSTYFNRLSPELKQEVLKRTEYALG